MIYVMFDLWRRVKYDTRDAVQRHSRACAKKRFQVNMSKATLILSLPLIVGTRYEESHIINS
jgi:hypothetical protein